MNREPAPVGPPRHALHSSCRTPGNRAGLKDGVCAASRGSAPLEREMYGVEVWYLRIAVTLRKSGQWGLKHDN